MRGPSSPAPAPTPSGRPGPLERQSGFSAGADTAVVRPSSGAGSRPSPSELYDTAYGDYGKGRYALAIQGFQEYVDGTVPILSIVAYGFG